MKSSKITNVFFGLAALMVLSGAIMNLKHIEPGKLIEAAGFFIGMAAVFMHSSYLKKKIAELEKENEELRNSAK